MTCASLFHEQRRGGGIEGAFGHQTVDGVGQMFAGDIIEVGADFHDQVTSSMRGGALA